MEARKIDRRAFTLIELMIVVIIIAILSAGAVPVYNSFTSRAYGTEVQNALSTVRTAQRAYRAANGNYAAKLTGDGSLQAQGFLEKDDFQDMKYVDWSHFSIPSDPGSGSGIAVWSGGSDVSNYDCASVTMKADGSLDKTEKNN